MVASPPTFDASALIKLAERTEYESWLLEDVYALVEQELFPSFPDAVVYPVDKSKGQFFGVRAMNIDLGDWRPGFLNAGAPLIFVTTFKLLDMLIEWTGVPSTYRFDQKLQHLRKSLIFPTLIESRDWLKERLISLYRLNINSLIPARACDCKKVPGKKVGFNYFAALDH